MNLPAAPTQLGSSRGADDRLLHRISYGAPDDKAGGQAGPDDASDAGLRFYASGLGRGRERGVVAVVLVGVGFAEVGDRVVELG
jgi:hypothetical protein